MAVGVTAKAGNVSVVALDIAVTAGKVTKVAAGVTAIAIAVIIAVVTANITSNVTSFAVNVTVVTIQPS